MRLTWILAPFRRTSPPTRTQSLDDRRPSLSDHHDGLSPEATLRPSRLCSHRVDHAPCPCLHTDDGLLPPSGPQPLPGRSTRFLRHGAATCLLLSHPPSALTKNDPLVLG